MPHAAEMAHLQVGHTIPHDPMATCNKAQCGLQHLKIAYIMLCCARQDGMQTCKKHGVVALRVDQHNGLRVLQPRVRVRCTPADTGHAALGLLGQEAH